MDIVNQTPAFIRTAVPAAVGALLSLLAVRYNVLVDENTSAALISGLTGLLGFIYYAIIKVAERKFPEVGILLGSTNQPIYVDPKKVGGVGVTVTAVEDDLIPRSEAERMAEEAATEAYRQIEANE